MSTTPSIDYDGLAKQFGAVSSAVPQPANAPDYDTLAKQFSGAPSSSGAPLTAQDAAAHPPVAKVSTAPIDDAYNKMTQVNSPAPFSPGEGAGLPLKAAADYMGALAPGSEAVNAASGVAEGAGKAIDRAGEMLHPEAAKSAAGKLFKNVEEAIGDHPVHITDKIADSISELKQGIDTGGNSPSVVNKLVSRIADIDEGPLTYKEARGFYSNLGDLSTSEKTALNTKMGRLVNNLKQALGESIQSTAEAGQKSAQYQQAMKGYATASQDAERLGKAKDIVGKWAGRAVVGTAGYALFKELEDILK